VTDQERVALLTARLGLPEGSLNADLALEALRHGSYVHERSLSAGREILRSNERLEFLGDAVLGYLIARRMYERFPDAPEGDLTRMRASLVREESLALVARQLGLGELLLLGRGEQRGGGRESAARLADVVEAVLGAVVLSCGLATAQEVTDRMLSPLFQDPLALARDPKTELQQLFQSRRRVPAYHVLSISGPDHARSYEVEVHLDGAALGRGSGRSKKEAEQAAARAALEAPDALDRALLDEPVILSAPDGRWTSLAIDEAARIRGALPEAAVEHVGATAVPMEGKPILDLLVGISDLSAAVRLPDYDACGEAGVPGRLYFRRRNSHSVNAQVVQRDGPLWRDAIALRDYLRAHPAEAQRYADVKRAALAAGATTLLAYSRAKAAVVEDLVEKARRWKAG
jgi:ribonuclease III